MDAAMQGLACASWVSRACAAVGGLVLTRVHRGPAPPPTPAWTWLQPLAAPLSTNGREGARRFASSGRKKKGRRRRKNGEAHMG
jgi:hypothetical protein